MIYLPSISTKGQVTIPKKIREKLGIKPGDIIEFIEENGLVYLQRKRSIEKEEKKFRQFKGIIKSSITSDQFIKELRGEIDNDNSD